MLYQDGNLRQFQRFRFEVIDIFGQHFNQPRWSSDTLALVQWVKKGKPNISTARCLLIPFVVL
ncbi:hypothetical protein QUB77_06760 [Microcoleus sp. AT9b-C3]